LPVGVVVWGTGNVGRPALRAVLSHGGLALAGVVVSSPEKVGRDAGELCGLPAVGVRARASLDEVLTDADADAVAYTASGDFRPAEAQADVLACLRAGLNVVTPAIYPLLHPASAPESLRETYQAACRAGAASIFVSGIDPGWAQDVLPLLLSGVCSAIERVRVQEIFNYATYDQPRAVRELVGLGGPMDRPPPMLLPSVPTLVWGGMLRTLADGLGVELERIEEHVEMRPLERTLEIPGMGVFEAGSLGAFRFEVRGLARGRDAFVIEHVTRICDELAPEWPSSATRGCHRVVVEGRPRLQVTLEADDGTANPAEGGNATAAARLVNAIPDVCAAPPGILGALDLPTPCGRGQLR
jgi:hypothetical protein